MKPIGFDNQRYLQEQEKEILARMRQFDDKLYLEFGGKLVFDHHAARVLPGYEASIKLRLLQRLAKHIDVIICIHAGDIERKKIRADLGISYDADALKLIDDLRKWRINVAAVVVTRYQAQTQARYFKDRLERRGVKVYCHSHTRGYPTDIDTIVSDEGYGANEYIRTTRPIVVVTGPGSGSGKLATCLSQLYHDWNNGHSAGYAKFETFPVWNLPAKHPLNIAYEAATADLGDINMIDPFHLDAHGQTATSYNRDIAAYPILKAIWEKITKKDCPYRSPTDMGVNRVGFGIVEDSTVCAASKQEVIRRYFRAACEYASGTATQKTLDRIEMLLKELNLSVQDRSTVIPARHAAEEAEARGKNSQGIFGGAALELADGTIVTGKNSDLMHASSSVVLNAIKLLANIPDNIHLLPPDVIQSIVKLKRDILRGTQPSLNLDEVLIALAISSSVNPAAQAAIDHLGDLRDCEMHLSHILTPGDEAGVRRIGLRHTSDPHYASPVLFASEI